MTMTEDQSGKPKRVRGEGSLFQKAGSRVWTIQFYAPGPDGKRRRYREATGLTSRSAAQKILTKRLAVVNAGEFRAEPRRRPVTCGELVAAVEKKYRIDKRIPEATKVIPLTRRWTHLQPTFGPLAAIAVTADHINNYKQHRQEQGARNATINRELATLKRAFSLGLEEGRIDKALKIKMLQENNTRQGFVEQSEFQKLAAAAQEPWLRLFLELGYTYGWRKGELLALRVRQVNFDNRTVRLAPGSTKNLEGREVTMTPSVEQLLRFAVTGKKPEDRVLTRPGNRPISDFRHAWRNLCIRAGLGNWFCAACGEPWTAKKERKKTPKCACGSARRKYVGLIPHDLRRSAAKAARAAGVPESVVMAMGGWKTAAMFRRYAIVSSADQRAAVEAIERARAAPSAPVQPPQEHSAQETVQPSLTSKPN